MSVLEQFWGSETILFDTIMVDTCHYTFGKMHRMDNFLIFDQYRQILKQIKTKNYYDKQKY